MKLLLFCFFTVIYTCFSQSPTVDKEEARKIAKEILVVTGGVDDAVQGINQMVANLRLMIPNVPENFWEDFLKEIDSQDLINQIVPIYVEQFTLDELKDILFFFSSRSGKKYLEKNSIVVQLSIDAGQKWGLEKAQKVERALIEKGYKKK